MSDRVSLQGRWAAHGLLARRVRELAPPASQLPPILVCAAAVALALALLAARPELVFHLDEWDFVLRRRPWTADALLAPHGEHLSLIPALAYKSLFAAVGIWEYWPYRLMGLLAHGLVAGAMYRYARPRVGGWGAAAAALAILCFGPGWAGVLWPFQIGYLGSLAAGIAMLSALDRRHPSGDRAAAVLAAVSLACSSVGLVFLLLLAAEVMRSPQRRRRAWLPAAPALAYAVWYLAYQPERGAPPAEPADLAEFVLRGGAATVAALAALPLQAGYVLGPLLLALLLWRLRRRGLRSRLLPLIALPVAYWTLTAVARAGADAPDSSRHLYAGAVLCVLAVVEAAAGVRISRRVVVTIAVGLFGAVQVSNLLDYRAGLDDLSRSSQVAQGALAGLEIAGEAARTDVRPAPRTAPQITAGAWLEAVAELGSPAPPHDRLVAASELTRQSADRTLIAAYGLGRLPTSNAPPAGSPPIVEDAGGGRVSARDTCVRVTFARPSAATFAFGSGGLLLQAYDSGATVRLRRTADRFSAPAVALARLRFARVRPPQDPAGAPWRARVETAGDVLACGAVAP